MLTRLMQSTVQMKLALDVYKGMYQVIGNE